MFVLGLRDVSRFVRSRIAVRLFSAGASAQVDRESIIGTVADASSAPVAGAKVTATNLETNRVVELSTEEERNYSAQLLH